MAKRIFLHVGTPKTGTTYLQSILWANQKQLAKQGLLLPLDKVRDHFFLSNLGRAAEAEIRDMPPHALTAWDRMMDQVAEWRGDALISHELFAMTLPDRAEWIIDALRSVADEVHPIITARDLARQVPAEWQQSIKHGRTHRLREFYGLIRAQDPSVLFWRAQDLPAQLSMWSQGLPPENVHLITVPPADGPRDLLWRRFAGVVGIDDTALDLTVNRPNESLGRVEIEMLRRVNLFAPQGAAKPLRQMMVRLVLAEGVLAPRTTAEKFAPPADEHPWVLSYGGAMVDKLRTMPCDVVGDLDELLSAPDPVQGPVPDDATEDEIAEVAVESISGLLYRSHQHETAGLNAEIRRLKETVGERQKRIRQLERELKGAHPDTLPDRAKAAVKPAAKQVRKVYRRVMSRSK